MGKTRTVLYEISEAGAECVQMAPSVTPVLHGDAQERTIRRLRGRKPVRKEEETRVRAKKRECVLNEVLFSSLPSTFLGFSPFHVEHLSHTLEGGILIPVCCSYRGCRTNLPQTASPLPPVDARLGRRTTLWRMRRRLFGRPGKAERRGVWLNDGRHRKFNNNDNV